MVTVRATRYSDGRVATTTTNTTTITASAIRTLVSIIDASSAAPRASIAHARRPGEARPRQESPTLEHLANLDHLAVREGHALGPFDGLVLRFHLDHPEPRDQLLVGERPEGHGARSARERDARALAAGLDPLAREHHAGFHHRLVEPSHRGDQLWAGEHARLGVLVGSDEHHESHRVSLWLSFSWPAAAVTGETIRAAAPAASGRTRRTRRGVPPPAASAPARWRRSPA